MTKLATRYVQDGNMVSREIAGETVLVPIRQNVGDLQCIFTLNKTGTSIWELLKSAKTVEEIALTLSQDYEVEVPEATEHVVEFIAQLKEIEAVIENVAG